MLTFLILAGGIGERFWPLSTKDRPKHLLKIFDDKSLLRKTIERILPIAEASQIFISTNADQLEAIKKEVPEIREENIIIEPMVKDTAAAIIYGSMIIAKTISNPTICALASDHLIKDEQKFRDVLAIAEKEAVENSNIVALGITPRFPETRFTYLAVENMQLDSVCKILEFTEKPNLEVASKYYANGNYLLNTGIIVYKESVLIETAKRFAHDFYATLAQIDQIVTKNEGVKTSELVRSRYALLDTHSIFSLLLRKSSNVVALASNFDWNDVGSYKAISEIFEPDEDLNIILKAYVVSTDSHDNIIIADNPDMKLALMGINNKIIVYTKDNILICEKNRALEVKQLIKKF